MEGTPGGSNTSLLEFQDDSNDAVHLGIEILVFPCSFLQGVRGLKGGLARRTGHPAAVRADSGVLALRHIEVPHQLDNASGIHPISHRCDVGIVDPAVAVGHLYMNEVIAVHGWPLAGDILLDVIRARVVPGHVGHNA